MTILGAEKRDLDSGDIVFNVFKKNRIAIG